MFHQIFVTVGISLVLVFGLVGAERIRYENYHVYEITPQTPEHVNFLRELDGSSDSIRFIDGIGQEGRKTVAVVAPHKQPDFSQMLSEKGFTYDIVEKNLQRQLDEEIDAHAASRAAGVYDWTAFHTLDETYTWLDGLVKQYPKLLTAFVVGKTYEGREIRGVKLSYKSKNPGVFLEAGIHAREWISPATATYFVNEFLTSTDPAVRQIAENYDWYIVPHTNPDGFVYTHSKDRLWRKTRSPQASGCYGADPNRNWGFHWNEVGASSSPCSDTFAGTVAFSEVETKSLSDYLLTLKGKINYYISFHSYSQLLLFPYGHTKTHASNHNDLQNIGNVAAKALAKRYGTKYTVGNIYEAIYPAAGSSGDWAFATINAPISFTYELRPGGSAYNGFVLPVKEIIPTGEETLDSVIALLTESKSLGY